MKNMQRNTHNPLRHHLQATFLYTMFHIRQYAHYCMSEKNRQTITLLRGHFLNTFKRVAFQCLQIELLFGKEHSYDTLL